MRVALIQMRVTADKAANLRTACKKIRAAKQAGADIAVLPEMFCCPYENRCFRAYGEPEGGEVQETLSRLAAEPAFGMTEAEMEAVLDPKLYIGRCPEQVDAFLAQVRPLLSGASREVPEISL